MRNMAEYSIIYCVVTVGNASPTLKTAHKYGIKGGIVTPGRGTVNSYWMEFFGLHEIRKEIVTMIAEKELAAEAIKGISNEMGFHKPHHGIAFLLSLSELFNYEDTVENESEINEVGDSMYQIIYVIVDKGKAEAVIHAANEAGARGGTIVNAKGASVHEFQHLFSVEIEPEKEKIFIITKADLKTAIVDAIRTRLRIDEPGTGIIAVLNLAEVYGLREN